MTKNERIDKLESEVRHLAGLLGYKLTGNCFGELEPNKYSPTLWEILKVLYNKLDIDTIFVETPARRAVKVFSLKEAKNAKR